MGGLLKMFMIKIKITLNIFFERNIYSLLAIVSAFRDERDADFLEPSYPNLLFKEREKSKRRV